MNRSLYWLKVALISCIVIAVFQAYLRYQYVAGSGTTWRIDRVTQQACKMRGDRAVCTEPASPPPVALPERGSVAFVAIPGRLLDGSHAAAGQRRNPRKS